MRTALLLVALAMLSASVAVIVSRTDPVRAEDTATLHISGLDIGKGEKAIVRLHNTSTHAADAFSVHYTVYALETLNGNPVALSTRGAGNGATLRAGDTLELDLGEIVAAYRAQQEAGPWDAPIRFVAFGSGGSFERFGPETIIAEGVQKRGRATFAAAVTWTEQ